MWEALAPVIGISVVALTASAAIILRGPFGKALAERIAGRASRNENDAEVERLRADMDQLRGVVGELEERLDFAERLLARQREAGRLAGGA
jgi:ubiquinone biosynthesis protein UbiJ